jgi:hypothetical protein
MLEWSPADLAQFHRHAPQWTHFSLSKSGTPLAPWVRAWPEHMAMQVFSMQGAQLSVAKYDVIGESGHGLHFAA